MVEALTNEDISRWLSAVTSTNAKCWVENPETIKESGFMTSKSYTTYRVLLKASDGELTACRHRFSDFETLRDNLRAKFFSYGLMVPALPPKKLTGTQDREFLTERMQGLSLLCEEIVSFPWFRKDPIWLSFMGSDLNNRHSITPHAPEDILTNMCSQLPMPYLPLDRLVEVKEEIVAFEKKLKVILDNLKQVQSALKQLQTANANLHVSVEAIKSMTAEDFSTTSKYLNGEAEEMTKGDWELKLQQSEQIPVITKALSNLVMEKAGNTANSAEYCNILFHSFLEREVARCSSIRELLKYHDDLSSSIEGLRINIEKLETKKAQTDKVKWQISDAKSELNDKNFLMDTFYKGFFFFTIPLSVKNRSENLRKLCEGVAATELVEGTLQQQSAVAMLSTMQVSAVQAVAETRAKLDLLSLAPLPPFEREEDLLSELGILPGMSLNPGTDWLVKIFKTYCCDTKVGGSGDTVQDEEDEEDEVVTPSNSRVSSHSPPPNDIIPTEEDKEDTLTLDTIPVTVITDQVESAMTIQSNQQDQDITTNNCDDDDKVNVEKEEGEDMSLNSDKQSKSKDIISDNLAFLMDTKTEAELKEQAEKNMSSLFGD